MAAQFVKAPFMPVAAPLFKRSAASAASHNPGAATDRATRAARSIEDAAGGYDARRGSSSARGYDWRWRKYSESYRRKHPLCVTCLAQGVPAAAEVVDHIEPHKGDMALFWEPANHQALCKPCHDRKTVMEDGGLRPGRVNWHPPFLRPSVARLTIVCGAPGSGKSRWVAEARLALGNGSAEQEIVIDLDEIGSALCGTNLHDWPRRRIVEVGRERNRQLMALSEPAAAGKRAWFIVSEPRPERRQWWWDTLKPAAIVVLETPPAECIRRINSDRERPRTSGRSVETWWRTYRRRPGDTLVLPTP